MAKFRGKYRISSTRLKGWDYGRNAIYFVTICAKNRHHFFGEILDGKMNLSEIGIMADKYWLEIPEHFPFVILHNHIVMPNHIHGLIEIAKNDKTIPVETQNLASLPPPSSSPPSSSTPPSSPPPSFPSSSIPTDSSYKNQFGPQSRNLSSIIRGYKIGVTKNGRIVQSDFQWQPRFYDHIVRNDQSFRRISNYIMNNPKQWGRDKFNTQK